MPRTLAKLLRSLGPIAGLRSLRSPWSGNLGTTSTEDIFILMRRENQRNGTGFLLVTYT